MKAIVVYHSLNGNTRMVAQAIADALDCDRYELTTKKAYPRARWLQMVVCGAASSLGRKPKLNGMPIDVSAYDTVILGAPVWAGTYAAPMATFLSLHDLSDKSVALFAAHASPETPEKFMARMKDALNGSRIIGQSDYQDPKKTDTHAQIERAQQWARTLDANVGG